MASNTKAADTASTTKKVNVLNGAEGIGFEINGRGVKVSETMKIEDAEHIAEVYPGVYVEVIEVDDKSAKVQPAQ